MDNNIVDNTNNAIAILISNKITTQVNINDITMGIGEVDDLDQPLQRWYYNDVEVQYFHPGKNDNGLMIIPLTDKDFYFLPNNKNV